MAATFTRCLVRLRCNTVVCVSVKQWPFFWATTVELTGCQFFLFSEALFGFKEFTFRPCRRPSLCFLFLSLRLLLDKVDVTVCYYSSPRSPRTARSKLLSALKYGNPVSTCFIIVVPSLHLRSACLRCLVSVSVWYLGFEGETNLAVYTTSAFSDERSPVISLRSSKNLEKTAYLGGGALNKQAVAVWYVAFVLFPIKYRLSAFFFFFFFKSSQSVSIYVLNASQLSLVKGCTLLLYDILGFTAPYAREQEVHKFPRLAPRSRETCTRLTQTLISPRIKLRH